MKHKESKIEISINLDENKIPEKIFWSADDANIKKQQTKATFISVWDDKKKESLRIDLWTKDMKIDEIKSFVSNGEKLFDNVKISLEKHWKDFKEILK